MNVETAFQCLHRLQHELNQVLCRTKIRYCTLHNGGANCWIIVFDYLVISCPFSCCFMFPCICTCTSVSSVSLGLGVKSFPLSLTKALTLIAHQALTLLLLQQVVQPVVYFVASGEEVVASSEWAFSVTADRTQSRGGGEISCWVRAASMRSVITGQSTSMRTLLLLLLRVSPLQSERQADCQGFDTTALLPAALTAQPPASSIPPYLLLQPLLSNTCPQPNLPNALLSEHWCNGQQQKS